MTTAAHEETLLRTTATKSQEVNLKVVDITGDTVTVHFDGLNNNNPNKYSNYAVIWQGDTAGYESPAYKTFPFSSDYTNKAGDFAFSGLTITTEAYVVGYAVGPELDMGQRYGNVCSTALIPAGSSDPDEIEYKNLKLTVSSVGSNTVTVKFTAPSGYNASANSAWLAIFRDEASYSAPPLNAAQVIISGSSGSASVSVKEGLGRGNTYTVAMYNSGWNADPAKRAKTAMGATVTFTVGG